MARRHRVGKPTNRASANWLGKQAAGDERVERLRTHPGIGLLTGPALLRTLELWFAFVIN